MKKRTINLLILNFCIAIAIWGLYFYFLKHIKETNNSLGEMKHKIVFAMKKEQAISNLRNRIQNNFKDGVDLNEFLIRSDQTAEFIQNIESFGPLTGTRIETQSVSTEEAVGFPGGVDFLRVIFNIEGQKSAVLKGINLIESLPYNLKINKLSFARSGDGTSTSKWSANLDLILVKLKEGQAPSTLK